MEELSAAEYTRIVRTVAVVCGDVGWAEDAVQHALLKALERPDSKAPIENLAGWCVSVATNAVRRRGRRQQLERRLLGLLAPTQPSSASVGDDAALDLHRAFASLPFRQRQVLGLYYFHDLDVRSIADALTVSEGTVKKALHRGRSQLAAVLEPTTCKKPEVNNV
jgi:RNA polymerase sigma-70 factor (ECF subfamily)